MRRMFPHRLHLEHEARIVRFADMPLDRRNVDALKGGLERQKEKDAELDVDALVDGTNRTIGRYSEHLAVFAPAFQEQFRSNLVHYLLAHVSEHDTDAEKGLDEREFDTYRETMMRDIDGILERFAPAEKKADDAAERAEQASASAEKVAEQRIENATFDENNLKNPDGVMLELRKFAQQSGDLQQESAVLTANVQQFQTSFQKFEEDKKDLWNIFSNIGRMIGSDPETDAMRVRHAELKADVDEKIATLRRKKADIAAYGQKLNAVSPTLRTEIQRKREEEQTAIAQEQSTLTTSEAQASAQLEALARQKRDMAETLDRTMQYRVQLHEQASVIDDARAKRRVDASDVQTFGNELEQGIEQIRQAQRAPNLRPEQRAELQEKERELRDKKTTVAAMRLKLSGADAGIEQADQDVRAALSSLNEESFAMDAYLQEQVDPAIASLEAAMRTMGETRETLAQRTESLESRYEDMTNGIDNVERQIASNVLELTLHNEKALTDAEQQRAWLDRVEVSSPNWWKSTVGAAFGKVTSWVETATNFVIHDVLWKGFAWVKEKLNAVHPALGYMLEGTVGVAIGVLEAGVGMVTGIGHLLAEPDVAIKGIGALIGRNPETGEFSWEMAGKAWGSMIGYEHFEKGDIGRGIGSAIVNVLTSATGAGAAGTGASVAAKAAGVSGRLAQAGRIGRIAILTKAAIRHPLIFAKYSALEAATSLKAVPGAIARAPGRLTHLATSEARYAGAVDDLARLTRTVDDTVINGTHVAELPWRDSIATKSVDDLCAAFNVAPGDNAAVYRIIKLKDAATKQAAALSHVSKLTLAIPDNVAGFEKRVRTAESLLGRELSFAEKEALITAHAVPMAGEAYTAAELAEKMRILKTAGFETDEASRLMRAGVAGTAEKVAENTADLAAVAERTAAAAGDKVSAYRSHILAAEGSVRTIGQDIRQLSESEPLSSIISENVRDWALGEGSLSHADIIAEQQRVKEWSQANPQEPSFLRYEAVLRDLQQSGKNLKKARQEAVDLSGLQEGTPVTLDGKRYEYKGFNAQTGKMHFVGDGEDVFKVPEKVKGLETLKPAASASASAPAAAALESASQVIAPKGMYRREVQRYRNEGFGYGVPYVAAFFEPAVMKQNAFNVGRAARATLIAPFKGMRRVWRSKRLATARKAWLQDVRTDMSRRVLDRQWFARSRAVGTGTVRGAADVALYYPRKVIRSFDDFLEGRERARTLNVVQAKRVAEASLRELHAQLQKSTRMRETKRLEKKISRLEKQVNTYDDVLKKYLRKRRKVEKADGTSSPSTEHHVGESTPDTPLLVEELLNEMRQSTVPPGRKLPAPSPESDVYAVQGEGYALQEEDVFQVQPLSYEERINIHSQTRRVAVPERPLVTEPVKTAASIAETAALSLDELEKLVKQNLLIKPARRFPSPNPNTVEWKTGKKVWLTSSDRAANSGLYTLIQNENSRAWQIMSPINHRIDVTDAIRSKLAPVKNIQQEAIARLGKTEGWKLHLNFDPYNPEHVQKVRSALEELKSRGCIVDFKVGRNSGQLGKESTVYIGHGKNARAVSQYLEQKLADVLQPQLGDALSDDILITTRIGARFDVGRGDESFAQYGSKGVPHLQSEASELIRKKDSERGEVAARLRVNADSVLRARYGSFYTDGFEGGQIGANAA